MIIRNNMPALRAHNHILGINRNANRSKHNLATGMRINSTRDDPAGMARANRMRREITGMDAARQNSLDGVSIIQTADGALNEVHAILQRIREMIVSTANDTMTDDDRMMFQKEIDQLLDEIDAIGLHTRFNGRPLFSGTFEQDNPTGADLEHGIIHIRTNTRKDNFLFLRIPWLNSENLAVDTSVRVPGTDPDNPEHVPHLAYLHSRFRGIVLDPQGDPDDYPTTGQWNSMALDLLDAAIFDISTIRAQMGAFENRLHQTADVLQGTGIAMQTALSRMVDTDMALEMSRLSSLQVISQAGMSVMAMANQRPQQLLALLNF